MKLRGMKGACAVAIALLASAASDVNAETYRAKHVVAVDGLVECNWARDRLITTILGPCEGFSPPRAIEIGKTFQANGKTKTINVIVANRIEKNMPGLGFKAGDWICSAAETEQDIPNGSSGNSHTGTWLYIAKCRPVN